MRGARSSRRRAPRGSSSSGSTGASAAIPTDSAVQLDAAARILRAIASLPRAQRAVVSLTALHELSQAEVFGVPVGTVFSRLHEARARLKAKPEPEASDR